jgi:hypothetical protein
VSEYQYYEFQAIDRPLSKEEMAELRQLSTRAEITSTRFVNVYNWGSFRGEPLTLMERSFDAFVYVTNWGTHQLMLRLPRALLDPSIAARYCAPEELAGGGETAVFLHPRGDQLILEFFSQEEEAEWDEGEGWLDRLLPLREELAGGDLRALYLGWLAEAQMRSFYDDESDEDATDEDHGGEPPVPPGLAKLSPALKALVEFLRLDEDLVAVAAEQSAPAPAARPAEHDLEDWIGELPEAEKNALLIRLLSGDPSHPRAELLQRFRAASVRGAVLPREGGGRSIAELTAAAKEHGEIRRREEAKRRAAEQARKQREAAVARAAYLDSLSGRENEIWRQVDTLLETTRAKDHERAVELLIDLRDRFNRDPSGSAYRSNLGELRARNAKRSALIGRLNRAGLQL